MTLLSTLFPETLFPRKLSRNAEQRVRLVQAHGEEALIRTHVDNALRFVDVLSADVHYERAIAIYIREMNIAEPLATVIQTRALAVLGAALVISNAPNDESQSEERLLPTLRLASDSARRKRA